MDMQLLYWCNTSDLNYLPNPKFNILTVCSVNLYLTLVSMSVLGQNTYLTIDHLANTISLTLLSILLLDALKETKGKIC